MKEECRTLGINISILERVMKVYYNRGLENYDIGWGQQFFLEYIAEHPGATPQELTEYIHVDKATVTKAIKKLDGADYIEVVADREDQRVRHIYLKERAAPVLQRISSLHREFYEDLTMGLTEQERVCLEEQTEKMIVNLTQKVRYKMETGYKGKKGGNKGKC